MVSKNIFVRIKTPMGMVLILVTILTLLLPLFVSGYLLYLAFYTGIWIILSLSVNLVSGYMGYPSMCHAAFYGIGAYAVAVGTAKLGLPPVVGFILGPILSLIFGFLVGAILLRIRQIHFAIGSMVFGLVMWGLYLNLREITGGEGGIRGSFYLASLSVGGINVLYYYIVLIAVIVILLVVNKMVNAYFGDVLAAIRENEDLAEHCGINTVKYKRITFALSAAFAGLAGAILASYSGYVTSEYFTSGASFFIFVSAIIGGMATIWGSVVGSIILVNLPEVLRFLLSIKPLVFGVILIIFIFFIPDGVVGGVKRLFSHFKKEGLLDRV